MNSSQILPEDFIRNVGLRGGVFTTQQARSRGLGQSHLKAAVQEGHYHRILPGLYSLAPQLDTQARIWGGLLIGGPESALGGEAAAFIRGEGPEPELLDVWCGYRTLKDRLTWRFHRGAAPEVGNDAMRWYFGYLAALREFQPAMAVEPVEELLRLSDRERFLELATSARAPGRSVLETRFARDVEDPHGLPHPAWEPVPDGRLARLQATYEEFGVRVVLDPMADGYYLDKRIDGPFPDTLCDEVVVNITWLALTKRACSSAHWIRSLLVSRGWQGSDQSCRSCALSHSYFTAPLARIHELPHAR